MAMSKDRVEFLLHERYYRRCPGSNGMSLSTCARILTESMDIEPAAARQLLDKNPFGVRIRCRPSQFARFIVLRHLAGECSNGIRDLDPRLVDGDWTIVRDVAKAAGVHEHLAERVLAQVKWRPQPSEDGVTLIDVSSRPHR